MADQLCTPSDLAGFMEKDLVTASAILAIETATAIVQSLALERIVGDYPDGSQELQLARAVVLKLAKDIYLSVVDSYEKAYEDAKAVMEASPHWRAALKLQYDRRVALIGAGRVQ
jgi:hypothetical protein